MFVFRSRIERQESGWKAQIVKIRPEEKPRVVWESPLFKKKRTVLAIAAETRLLLLKATEEGESGGSQQAFAAVGIYHPKI